MGWTHVSITYDGSSNLSGCKIYINGTLDVTGSSSSITSTVLNNYAFVWGASSNGSLATPATYDDTRIYSRELDQSEVTMIYNSGNGTEENKPTNVQDNSILVEKDTGERYWFSEATAVTEETLDSTNGTTDWNVTNGGSDITIDSTNKEIDITGTGQKSGYYDLGASVSASAWVLRFKIASSGSPSGNPIFWVGMFDVNTIDSRNTNVDGISLMMYTGGDYKLSMKNGSHMDSGGSQTDTSPTVSADTTTRYVEIVRNGSNAILTFYDSDTYTTSIGTCTVAITGTSFRYLCAISYFEVQVELYSLSNVKFYNGVTSATPDTWTNPVCASTISSTATMGSNGDFDVEYTTVASKTGSGQRGCNAWEFDGLSTSPYTGRNAVKGATNADFAVSSSTAFTIAAWVKLNTLGQQHTILGYSGHYTNTFWTNLGISASNKVEGHTANNGISNNYIPTGNSLSVDTWHHCVFIHEADKTVTVYLDADTANKGTGTGDTGSASSGYWTIAGRWGQAVTIPTFPFLDGFIDQATLWNVALSEADVTTLYNGGRLTPPSVSQNNIKGYWTFSETSGAAENKAV